MHALLRSCERSSSKITLGFLLMFAPLLSAQNTPVQAQPKKDLPDAPMPTTAIAPSFTRQTLPPRFDATRTQSQSRMGMSPAIGRPTFNTNALGSEKSRVDGKDMKVAGRSPVNWSGFDSTSRHANRTAAQSSTQWYTSHIPWAGPIMRQGLKISKAHPHLTTVIKTIKPRL
jgi:hypothetical protein